MPILAIFLGVFSLLLSAAPTTLQVEEGVRLAYREQGKGKVLLFVPGWTYASEVFEHQIAHFSKTHRVIAIDPRGQGDSTKAPENNTYVQQGKDIARFAEKMGLEKFTLVGWSYGCLASYGYVRHAGVKKLDGFVCIDQPPKTLGGPVGDWTEGSIEGERDAFNGITYRREIFTREFTQWMVERKLTDEEMDRLVKISLKTPTYVALLLGTDGIFSDYSEEAKLLAKSVPTFSIVREEDGIKAAAWIKKHAPATRLSVLGKHMMFWEMPKEFNAILEKFLR